MSSGYSRFDPAILRGTLPVDQPGDREEISRPPLDPKPLTAYFRVRSEDARATVRVRCRAIEHVIRRGKQLFPNFDSRNPWIFQDSDARAVHVLVDAENPDSGGRCL
jgi:hypothetical protein